ncbi:MAG TPA: alpha/beta fold hydrolase [Solirubrobacterales bacterium]|nr:alpha/beta fold hydrolase [Solirubrobacterales bacterium]
MGERGETTWLRRRWRWLVAPGLALLAALAIGAAVAWHFSDAVLAPDHSPWPESTEVLGVSPRRISLARSEDSERPGVYGLDWPGGHAVIGAIEHESEDTVVRRLLSSRGYLASGRKVLVEADVYAGNPREALGIPFSTVRVPDELGPMPEWLVAGHSSTWAIVVHGINGTPQEGLHLLPALRRAGLSALLITYREDLGAPPSPDGLHHMGLTEWRDLQAAARYALAHGARRLVLVGYSMGGAIVAQFIQKSRLAGRVSGLVLDAPALDWKRTIEFNSEQMGLPGFAALPVIWAVGARIDADWDSLDALAHPEAFHLPILLFHGLDDKVVPIATSDDFAAELSRWVTYYRVPRADHVQSWNVDPRRYERRLQAFLASLEPVGGGGRTTGH